MIILKDDLYINCDILILEANEIYKEIKKENKNDYIYYFESMNKYINTYTYFKEKQIKEYIKEMKDYLLSI
jgi:hypothetical protein